MSRQITILWIEDELDTSRIKIFQKLVTEIIEDSYYKVNIINALNKKVAEKKLQENHIDLILSDYNLAENKTGVEFLTEYRSSGKYKYYILYSNNDEIEILNKIIEQLKKERKIHLFSNFDFISLSNGYEVRVEEALGVFLNNRNKLEELRNMYIVENALIEDRLKDLLPTTDTYCNMIKTYSKKNGIKSDIVNLWHSVRKDRNVLAHGTMLVKNGIASVIGKNGGVISEKEFYKKIEKLKELDEELENLNFF